MIKDRYRVCFVCTGNICRSPMAETVLRARLADAGLDALVESRSAGTGGWHVGGSADPRTEAVLSGAGYEPRHTARQFEPGWFAAYDLVVALDRGHLRELRAMAPTGGDARKVRPLRGYAPGAPAGEWPGMDVPDPYYGGVDGFAECLRLIEEAMPGLLAEITAALDARGRAVGGALGGQGERGSDAEGAEGFEGAEGAETEGEEEREGTAG